MINHPTTELLSDEALERISSKRWVYSYGDDREDSLPDSERGVVLTVAERDALCQTVRALREAQQPTRQVLETYLSEGEQGPPGLHDLAHLVTERLHSDNAALRDQLAQLDPERDRWEARAKQLGREVEDLESKITQLTRERDDYRDQLVEAKAETVERLAQVEKEREQALVNVLEEFRSKNIRRIDLIAALAKADLLHAEEQP